MVMDEYCEAVAIVAGDAVGSMDSAAFLERADAGLESPPLMAFAPVSMTTCHLCL